LDALQHIRVVVAECESTCAGKAVQILFVIRIGQPDAFRFGDSQRQLARVTPDIRFEFSLTGQKGFVVCV
jgi:hypothetical protein